MDEFTRAFKQMCKTLRIEPPEVVVDRLRSGNAYRGKLDLSSAGLTSETCIALASVLSADKFLTELYMRNCMLPEEGLWALADALCTNSTLKLLDLQGNGIQRTGVKALSKLMQNNRTLNKLILEWNHLGSVPDNIAIFSEGLRVNCGLVYLDLRSNQINHQGAAEIAEALKKNTTLQIVDLRWNSIGLMGGQSILHCLQFNQTLLKIDLMGCDIPSDILSSIQNSVVRNASVKTVVHDKTLETEKAAMELYTAKKEHNIQLHELLSQLELRDKEIATSNKMTSDRFVELSRSLQEKDVALHSLKTENENLQVLLVKSEQQIHMLESDVKRLSEQTEYMMKEHHNILQEERKERIENERRLLMELTDLRDKRIELERMVQEIEQRCRDLQQLAFQLKEDKIHMQADMKVKIAEYEEQLKKKDESVRQAERELVERQQVQILEIHHEYEKRDKELQCQLQNLETQRTHLEELVNTLNSKLINEKQAYQECLLQQLTQCKAQHDKVIQDMEQRYHLLLETKMGQDQILQEKASLINELESRNTSLQSEADSYYKQVSEMQQELGNRRDEIKLAVSRTELEVKEMHTAYEQERERNIGLRKALEHVEKTLEENSRKFSEDRSAKNRELESLQDKLLQTEHFIKQLKEDYGRRTALLQSAFTAYVGGGGAAPNPHLI